MEVLRRSQGDALIATIIRTTEVTHQPQTAVIVIVDLAILVIFVSVRRQDSQGVVQLVLRVEL